jgi:hypothetical protein
MIETYLTSRYRKMKSIARSMLADGGAKEIPQPAYSPHDSPMRFHHVWLVTLYCSQGVCDQVTGQDEVHVVACDHGKGATYSRTCQHQVGLKQ